MWPVGSNDRNKLITAASDNNTSKKKKLSISCGRRKPLSVIYSPELEATGHVCTEWIMLVLCDSELNGYLCRSVP